MNLLTDFCYLCGDFFISLPIKISVLSKQKNGHTSCAQKKTYIFLKVIITSAITLIIMLF